MSMRKQLFKTVESVLEQDERLVLLLGDIGIFGFRKAFEKYGDRVFNVGILEQSTISMAAGLAMNGLIPVVHTIAPFLVERCFEQLKIGFGYQQLGGNFISVGASYDYAALGCTHHCPADVGILKNIPAMGIVLPGTASEFDLLFRQTYSSKSPKYFRLSERENLEGHEVIYGKAKVLKKGVEATVVAVGPLLKPVLEACGDLDVTILYYTTVVPFDHETIRQNCLSKKVLLCEPYYHGALTSDIAKALHPRPVLIDHAGVPHRFLRDYGHAHEHDEYIGVTAKGIREKVWKLIHA